MKEVKCIYEKCVRFGTLDCEKCENNRIRNKGVDAFVPCKDKDYSEHRTRNGRYKTTLVGSAEQGGLKCPACGCLNNAYTFDEKNNYECSDCGLPLTTK